MHFIQHFNQTFSWDKFDYHRIVLSSNKDREEAKREEIDQIIRCKWVLIYVGNVLKVDRKFGRGGRFWRISTDLGKASRSSMAHIPSVPILS